MSLCPQTKEILTYHPLELLFSLKDSSTYVSPTVIYRGGNQSVYFGEENMLSLALKIWDLISHAKSLKYFKEKIKFGKRKRLCNLYTGQTDFVWKCDKIHFCGQFLSQFGYLFWVRISKRTVSSFIWPMLQAYSEPGGTSKLELFAKIVHGFQPLFFFAKSYILDVWLGSEHASGCSLMFFLGVSQPQWFALSTIKPDWNNW